MAKKKKKLSVRHRNKKGQFSKRGKRERVYSHAKTILRRIAKRERAKEREAKKQIKEFPLTPPGAKGEVFEWIVNFTYERSGRSFDVIPRAVDETEAYNIAVFFLQEDREAQRIVRSGFKGWIPSVVRANKTTPEMRGQVEYRSKSKA